MNARNHGLDLLRFFAIMSVLLLHAGQIIQFPDFLHETFKFGWVGVDLFFVLSGFLIGRQVFAVKEEEPLSDKLSTFWMKRWFRTFPLYYFVLFVYVWIKPALGFPFKDWNYSFFFFLQNYMNPVDFVQSWSLCIEEQFYIVFPIVAFVLKVRARSLALWCIPMLVSIVSRYWLWRSGAVNEQNEIILSFLVRFPFHTHLDGLTCGILLAATFSYWREFGKKFALICTVVGMLILFTTLYFSGADIYGSHVIYAYTSISVGFSLLLMGSYRLQLNDWVYVPVKFIALWSYGLYLWNNLVMRVMMKMNYGLPWWLNLFIFLLITIVISAVTYYLIEEVFLKLRDRVLLQRYPVKKVSG